MELKYKLSDYNDPLLKTETTKMPEKQMEVILFVDSIDNARLMIRQAFHSARIMLLLPVAITFFVSFLYGVNMIYIEPWKKTEDEFITALENKKDTGDVLFSFQARDRHDEDIYIKNGKLSFVDYWKFRYYSGTYVAGDNSLFEVSILLVQLLVSIFIFGFAFLIRSRPPLICDRKNNFFILGI